MTERRVPQDDQHREGGGLRGEAGALNRPRRHRGGTRERILDIALDLFTDRGYDKTSLREIAEELGFTKAALYYHFERKEDMLLALHLRLHELGRGIFDQLDDLSIGDSALRWWTELLDTFIDQVLANRKLFLFHARNHNALEELRHDEHSAAEHEDMEERLRSVLSNPAIPVALRVRMACSMGAVMGVLMDSGGAFSEISSVDLAGFVRAAVRDLLGTEGPGPRARAQRSSRNRR